MTDLKIGADPELFLKKGKRFVSAHGVVPGTKAKPYRVIGGAVQVDGMALEFNINPARKKKAFVHNIFNVLATLREMVPEDFDFSFEAVAHFTPKYINGQPEMARMLGCDPDFDAYTERMNDPPNDKLPMRTAAGHIHIGWYDRKHEIDEQHLLECKMLTKQLDYILGIPSVVLDRNTERRKMYGQAGSYRPKQYGVEYRVLSNFWLKEKKLVEWVFDATCKAFTLLTEQRIDLPTKYGDTARNIINNSRVRDAKRFVRNELKQFDVECVI